MTESEVEGPLTCRRQMSLRSGDVGGPTFKTFSAEVIRGCTAPAAPMPTRPQAQGKTHGETVSLRIELAAYFRRPNLWTGSSASNS